MLSFWCCEILKAKRRIAGDPSKTYAPATARKADITSARHSTECSALHAYGKCGAPVQLETAATFSVKCSAYFIPNLNS